MSTPDTARIVEYADVRCLALSEGGPPINDAASIRDLIEEAMSRRGRVIAVPVARLDSTFFDLSTRFAGELLQKAVNYHFKLAFIGDVSAEVARSTALRDLIVEANRGHDAWFVADMDALRERLEGGAKRG